MIADQYEALLDNTYVHPDQCKAVLQDRENQVLGVAEFTAFLTVSMNDGGTAQVNVVSNFSTGLGAAHPLNGMIFTFLSETLDK